MSAAAGRAITIAAFEDGVVDIDAFDHEAHVYLGWLYTREFELLEAVRRFTAALTRLTRDLGIPGKYHETITWFYLLLIAERRNGAADDWITFRRQNADLFARGEQNILNRYYRRATLASSRARHDFVLPDRLAG